MEQLLGLADITEEGADVFLLPADSANGLKATRERANIVCGAHRS